MESEKRQQAIALQYSEGDKAPRVVASGAGEIARRILELAKEHNVPIRQDDSLVSILSKLNLGYEIPAETYQAVAQILAFLYKTDEAWRQRKVESHSLFREANQTALPQPEHRKAVGAPSVRVTQQR